MYLTWSLRMNKPVHGLLESGESIAYHICYAFSSKQVGLPVCPILWGIPVGLPVSVGSSYGFLERLGQERRYPPKANEANSPPILSPSSPSPFPPPFLSFPLLLLPFLSLHIALSNPHSSPKFSYRSLEEPCKHFQASTGLKTHLVASSFSRSCANAMQMISYA